MAKENIIKLSKSMRPRPDLSKMSPLEPFLAAPEVEAWIRETFIDPNGPLHNPDHQHLQGAQIGVLWASSVKQRQMRRVVGQAEMPMLKGDVWTKERLTIPYLGWFGSVPDFVLTFDAWYADQTDDTDWCALVEHELYHCAQARDEFGAPRFTSFGAPVFGIRGHDVEEFVGVVRRYGVTSAALDEMVAATQRPPEVSPIRVAHACGTCRTRAA